MDSTRIKLGTAKDMEPTIQLDQDAIRATTLVNVDELVFWQFATLRDHHLLAWGAALRAHGFDRLQHVHALHDATEHDVATIQPRRLDRADEELAAVRVGSRVCHTEHTRASVLAASFTQQRHTR